MSEDSLDAVERALRGEDPLPRESPARELGDYPPARQTFVHGERWCLAAIDLPSGTEQQVLAWIENDPRPNAAVRIYEPPNVKHPDDVWFVCWGTREILRLPVADFTERYQRLRWVAPTPEQVPPERPPASLPEMVDRRLAGW